MQQVYNEDVAGDECGKRGARLGSTGRRRDTNRHIQNNDCNNDDDDDDDCTKKPAAWSRKDRQFDTRRRVQYDDNGSRAEWKRPSSAGWRGRQPGSKEQVALIQDEDYRNEHIESEEALGLRGQQGATKRGARKEHNGYNENDDVMEMRERLEGWRGRQRGAKRVFQHGDDGNDGSDDGDSADWQPPRGSRRARGGLRTGRRGRPQKVK